MVNYYESLGVDAGAAAASIRRAYVDAARRYHPDFHVDADEQTRTANARRMQELNEAWKVLGDPTTRIAYDRSLLAARDPGVARRAAREPDLPAGKGWTPRAGDDGWMTDYQGWLDDEDELAADQANSTPRTLVTMAPVGLLVAAFGCFFVGLLVDVQAVVALGAVCVIFSAGLFVMLPMFEMARGRGRR